MGSDRPTRSASVAWLVLLSAVALAVGAVLLLGRMSGMAQANRRMLSPTGTIPGQIVMLTSIYATMEAAEATPLPPWVYWTATPDLRPLPTPNYSGIPHLWTDSGVIIDGPPAVFENCYKMSAEINGVPAPWVENMWYQTSGADEPEVGVYAGSYADVGDEWPNLPRSAVFIVHVRDDPCVLEPHFAPFEEGPLEIIAAQGSELLLRSTVTGRTIAFSIPAAAFRTSLATATPGPAPTPRAPVALPSLAADYAVLALDSLAIGPQAEVARGVLGLGLHSSPNQGLLEVGPGSYLGPYSTLASNEIFLGPGVTAAGILVANDIESASTARVFGPVVSALATEVDLPPVPAFTVDESSPSVTVEQGGSRVLPPGDYSDVRVGPAGRLVLLDGTFDLIVLRVERGASVECPGSCSLRVVESVYLGPSAGMTRSLTPGEESVLSLFVQGFRGLTAAEGSTLDLLAYVPVGPIDLGPGGSYWGTYVAARFTLRRDSTIVGPAAGP